MTITAIDIFNYLRGGLRGTSGLEDLRGKRIVILGLGEIGQDLLSLLCIDETEVFFYDESVVNYISAHKICQSVQTLDGDSKQYADVVINLYKNKLSIDHRGKFKTVELSNLGENPYTQGIHDFYLQED